MPLFTSEYVFSDDYPTIEPSLKLDFANARALDPRITFTRASTATYVGKDELIKTARVNEPRFDHDPTTGESLGLLIEESRINEILNSQVFTSGYNQSGLNTLTQDTTVTTPEGLTDGVGVITESSGGTVHQFYEASSAQITGIRTYSIFVKPNGRNYCVLMTSSFTHDLVNGTTLGSASGEYVSATTTKFANGWVRCTVTVNHSNSFDQFNFKLAKDGHQDYSYSGDGTSGVYVWGAQLEAGSFSTSYIPTSGSTVTRATDNAVISGESFNSFYNQSEGTVICKFKKDHWPVAAGNDITYERIWEISNGSDITNLNIFNDPTQPSGNNIRYRVRTSGTNSFGPLNASTGSNQTPTVALGYAKDNFVLVIDGTLVAADTSGDLPVVDRLHIGSDFAGTSQNRFNNTISKLIYYPKRILVSQVESLTQ